MQNKEDTISAKKVVATSFIVDILDITLTIIVAGFTGSVIMLTEVLEGISDLVSSGLLLIGLKRSQQRADRTHPFGYGREIYFWTLLAALVMFAVTSTVSIYFGWQRFMHPTHIHSVVVAQVTLLITFFTNGYAFYLSYRRLLRKRKPHNIIRIFYRSSLVETKTTFILDLMGTVASLVGMISLTFYSITGDIRFDGLGAIVIGIVLAFFAFLLVMGIRDLLVGRSASVQIENKIREAALDIEEVREVMDLKTMHIGSEKLLVNLEVNMDRHLETRELEKLIDEIKAKIQLDVPSVKYIQVELETPDVV